MANNGRNKLLVPGADNVLDKLKLEIATELGLPDYDKVDKGALPARVHGAIGGSMTKRLVEMGQQMLANQGTNQSNLDFNQYQQDMIEDLQNATNPPSNASSTTH